MFNPMMVGIPLQVAGTGINMYRNNKFLDEAQSQLRDLEAHPIKPYSLTDDYRHIGESYRYGASNPTGMPSSVYENFINNQARTSNTAYSNALRLGGGKGVLGVLNAGNSMGMSNLAAQMAQMIAHNRMANMSGWAGVAGVKQNIDNMNAKANIDLQSMYGQTIRQLRQNNSQAWSSLANLGGMMTGYGLNKMITDTPSFTPSGTSSSTPSSGDFSVPTNLNLPSLNYKHLGGYTYDATDKTAPFTLEGMTNNGVVMPGNPILSSSNSGLMSGHSLGMFPTPFNNPAIPYSFGSISPINRPMNMFQIPSFPGNVPMPSGYQSLNFGYKW